MTTTALETVPFHAAAIPAHRIIVDEHFRSCEHRIDISPTGGWLRFLEVAVRPAAVELTHFCDASGMPIYRVTEGAYSAEMYPAADGYRIPFELAADGRGSLEDRDHRCPYFLDLSLRSPAAVRITAHYWEHPPTVRDGQPVRQTPPYPGNTLRHSELRFSDPDNWGVMGPHDPLTRGHCLHRLWVFDGGRTVVTAVEYANGKYSHADPR